MAKKKKQQKSLKDLKKNGNHKSKTYIIKKHKIVRRRYKIANNSGVADNPLSVNIYNYEYIRKL